MARPLTYAAWLGLSLSLAVVGYQVFGVGQPLDENPGLTPSASASPFEPTDPPPVRPLTSSTVQPTNTVQTTGPAQPGNPVRPPLPASAPAAPAAQPTTVQRVELPVAGYSSEARIMEIADSGVIDPPDFTHVWWVRDRGVAPSRGATDTAYLACHTHSGRSAADVPCNRISPEAIPVGSPLTVTTDVEQLTYTVTSVKLVAKDEFADDEEIWGVHPGRLVWVTCYLENGQLSDFNAVVIAELAA